MDPPAHPNTLTVTLTVRDMPPTPTKFDTKANLSIFRKLISFAVFFFAFASVMALLLVYMRNTAMRHHQFRVNMSQDYELLGIAQDDPQLVTYIKAFQLKPAIDHHHHQFESDSNLTAPEDTSYVLKLLNYKKGGFFVEAGAYNDGKTSKTEFLERQYGWNGLLVQPDPRNYFNLIKHNRVHSKAVHAFLSPNPYPKEVSFHQNEFNDVRINSVHSNSLVDDEEWFNTRVKCFPLYSLLLAMNTTNVDYFSLESWDTELQVLETIPFNKVNITVIGVHLLNSDLEKDTITNFLGMKNYRLVQKFNSSYIYLFNY